MKLIFLFILIVLITNTGCEKPGCLGKAGSRSSQTIPLSAFKQVRLTGNIDLVLKQGTTNSLTLEGPGNILPDISHTITDGKLLLENMATCRWARDPDEKITATLTFTDIDKLEYEGSGNVSNTDTLRLNALLVESFEGAGDVELTVANQYTGVFLHIENPGVKMHGSSVQCNTYTSARGLTDMRDFMVQNMVIEYGGLADTYINVTSTLSAIIYYKGNVYYKGNPSITRSERYSTGQLIARP